MKQSRVRLRLRRQKLVMDDNDRSVWEVAEETKDFATREVAMLVCDVWDRHWSRGATERAAQLALRITEVLKKGRSNGVNIIHSPAQTMDFYEGTAARDRAKNAPFANPPTPIEYEAPPHPLEWADGGSDTNQDGTEKVRTRVWTRQIETIEIDDSLDSVTDDGPEVYNLLQQRGIRHVMYMGIHTNGCILTRRFAIKAMRRWGVDVSLFRDLTDAIHNPASPPYVNHDEATKLSVAYIEKFWCPSVSSAEIAYL